MSFAKREADIAAIVGLLSDDVLGQGREQRAHGFYRRAGFTDTRLGFRKPLV